MPPLTDKYINQLLIPCGNPKDRFAHWRPSKAVNQMIGNDPSLVWMIPIMSQENTAGEYFLMLHPSGINDPKPKRWAVFLKNVTVANQVIFVRWIRTIDELEEMIWTLSRLRTCLKKDWRASKIKKA